MTHDEMIAVIAAHRDGKAVQARMKEIGTWRDFKEGETPIWNFHECDYRAKPEPREWWLVEDARAITGPYECPQVVSRGCRLIHVREVLPE